MNGQSERVSTSRLANLVAQRIQDGLVQFQNEFQTITQRAKDRFGDRDWRGLHGDAAERLDVYASTVDQLLLALSDLLGDRLHSRRLWMSSKAVYSGRIHGRDDWELAETFFNSITRRIFTTVGVDNEVEFVHTDYHQPPTPANQSVYGSYFPQGSTYELVLSLLANNELPWSAREVEQDARLAAQAVEERLQPLGGAEAIERIDMVRVPFYRGEYAFLVGRMVVDDVMLPLAFCVHHGPDGCCIDAVLTEEDEVSLLFSFTRSYFHVEVERPYELVQFIASVIPRKPLAELYICIGYNRHGKTEMYRDVLGYMSSCDERYELAAGPRGMVMIVFTVPSFPVVFKIIKDHFEYPKDCTRESVIDRYRLIFKHDRAGRLIDAQEFQFLELDLDRFHDPLLEELLKVAGQTVSVHQRRVVIRHCYVERRVTPLNVYLQSAHEEDAFRAIIDYGYAIKDLAYTNLFPGDLLLKNFGVTRQKRVVFYDYDEVCLLTDCKFRELPEDYDFAPEPFFSVGRYDVFPEEFPHFLGLSSALREVFLEYHADLFEVGFWRDIQNRLRAGEIFDIAPYGEEKRLGHRCLLPS